MTIEQQKAADALRAAGLGDRKIAETLGLTYSSVRWDREKRHGKGVTPKPPEDGPKVLLFDIETAPALVWVWSQWQTNVIATEQDWYMLCYAYKWLHDEGTGFVSIFQDPDFEPETSNDRYVVERLRDLLDEADYVIAHNGDKFDVKKTNARIIYHDLLPPSPYRTIDTRKEASRSFANYSNALNELGRLYEIGAKVKHEGFSLWRSCMAGDADAWGRMEEYARQDVELLEGLYLKLLPWIGAPGKRAGVNHGFWADDVCSKCGAEGTLIKRGTYRTTVSEYQALQCKACGGYSREAKRSGKAGGTV